MKPGGRAAVALLGAGLATSALLALRLAVATGAAASAPGLAPAASTSISYFPLISAYVTPSPTPAGTPLPVTPPAAADWKSVLNYYRASARLPALGENSAWSSGAFAHARYMVENDVLATSEDPGNAWYSPDGATEAANSNLMLSDNVNTSDKQAVDFWMQKPFHALGLLDPGLQTTGFGSYRNDAGQFDPYRMGAVVDVRQGLGPVPSWMPFPIKWPDHNTTVTLTSYDGNEQPDPLTSCPGYTPPSGLPILLQLGPGGSAFSVNAHSFMQGGVSLPHCVFDPNSYANPMSLMQNFGRQILAASDAVVLIPQAPLTPSLSYTASITVNGHASTWTFHVAP